MWRTVLVFATALASALALALARDSALAAAFVSALALALAFTLARAEAETDGVLLMLGRVLQEGILALAVRILPASQRPRYRDEFRGELRELRSRREEQRGYAFRVLAGAWELRRALVEAVRTTDGAVARRAKR